MNMQKNVYVSSLGCSRNLVDTEVMLGILKEKGFVFVLEGDKADFIIVNTCGFLQAARDEAIEIITDLMKNKKKSAKVVITGCMVQKHSEELKAHFPDVHYYLGSGDVDKILMAVSSPDSGENISDLCSYLEKKDTKRMLSTPAHYAYVKIAEGCKKRCTYCLIPEIKGKLQSKTEEQILSEINSLIDDGVFEIILIAQDLGDYGKDLKIKNGLASLIKKILHIKKDFWLRLLYLYPDEITDELIDLMASDKRICPYLDIPLQHINDDILKAMGRKTSKKQIINIIKKLREKIPNITIRTSIIVGFPGETEQQFSELMAFIKEISLDHVGIFPYSQEKGTKAAKLPNQVEEELKISRQEKLAEIQFENVLKANQKLIGKKIEAIVEGYYPSSPYLMQARHSGQSPDVDNVIIINDGRLVTHFGKRYLVEITDVADYDLIGEVVGCID